MCLLNADSPNPSVRRDSQQLLIYLLYSLSLKHLEAAQVGAPDGSHGQLGVCLVVSSCPRVQYLVPHRQH